MESNGNRVIPELMVPAKNLKILKFAVQYGADAVYIGGKKFNLRSMGGNFRIDEFEEGIRYAHEHGKKVYLTLNSFLYESETGDCINYVKRIKNLPFDGIIISDPGVLHIVKQHIPETRIHISTQANITNLHAAGITKELGASRVNLAREISFEDLKKITKGSGIEIEVFVHGALCISYSGRCMLSKYMSGRDANKGECVHSCRWKYYLMEEERQNMFFPVVQDHGGTFIYNSRDLCLLPRLKEITETGVSSIKIEGRMKTESYVSLTTQVYRTALDLIKENKFSEKKIKYLMGELDKCSHRNYTTGFMFAGDKKELEDNENVGYITKYRFVGIVKSIDNKYESPVIMVKNQFSRGQLMDITQPDRRPLKRKIDKILSYPGGVEIGVANTNDTVLIPGLGKLHPYSILRTKL